jgi:hypothetical protein
MSAHTLTRTPGKARITGPRLVTYSCNGCEFAITDTGDEAKRQWLRHLLAVEKPAEVTS